MDNYVIASFLTVLGTMVSSFAGVLISNRLTNYRIEQLEKKVDEHNGFGKKIPVIQEQIKVVNHRLDDLEEEKR